MISLTYTLEFIIKMITKQRELENQIKDLQLEMSHFKKFVKKNNPN